jgi:hypothetical protein
VRVRAVAVREIRLEDRAQVSFAEDDDMIEAVAANGVHDWLHECILLRRLRRCLDPFDAKPG